MAEQLNHTDLYNMLAWFTCSEHTVRFQGVTSSHLESPRFQNSAPFLVKVSLSKNNSSGDLLKS